MNTPRDDGSPLSEREQHDLDEIEEELFGDRRKSTAQIQPAQMPKLMRPLPVRGPHSVLAVSAVVLSIITAIVVTIIIVFNALKGVSP